MSRGRWPAKRIGAAVVVGLVVLGYIGLLAHEITLAWGMSIALAIVAALGGAIVACLLVWALAKCLITLVDGDDDRT